MLVAYCSAYVSPASEQPLWQEHRGCRRKDRIAVLEKKKNSDARWHDGQERGRD